MRKIVSSVAVACAFFLAAEPAGATLTAPKKKEAVEAAKVTPKKKDGAEPAKSAPKKKEAAGPTQTDSKKKETAKKEAAGKTLASKAKETASKAKDVASKAKEVASSKVKEATSKAKDVASKTKEIASKAKEKTKAALAALKKKKLPPPALSGIASVYAYKKRSRSASGEFINFKSMIAAHRTFRFGTKVRVTNRKNGKTVIVRIIDRGPFIRGRVIDLSPAAARELGMGWGLAPVTLAVVTNTKT